MSLYDEAIVETKKLKQIAEEDAKKAIIEDITPTIRKMIARELAGKASPLFEEEDKTLMGGAPGEEAPPVVNPSVDAGAPAPITPAGAEAGGEISPAPAVVGGPMDAPIKVAGADALNMPMPGPDGKLVVDFDDLFIPSEPGDEAGDEGSGSAEAPPEIPGGLPSPTPVDANPSGSASAGAPDAAATAPAGEGEAMVAAGEGGETKEAEPVAPTMETYELFAEALDNTAKKVHRAYSSKHGVPSLMKEALQDRLFQLLESLETLVQKNVISSGLGQIFENRLEILHLKLKEALVGNTYYRTEGTEMASKSLKEMAAKMLAESETIQGGPVTSPADVHKTEKPMKVDNAEETAADKAGTHAMKVTEPTVTLKTEAAELAKLEEELKALIAENPGDSLVAEPGKQDLAGAASTIPDKKVGEVDPTKTPAGGPTNPASHVQGVSENIEHSKETGSEQEVGKTSTGHPVKKESVAVNSKALAEQTKKIKAEALKKQIAALQEQLKECGMEMEGSAASTAMPGTGGSQSVMGEDDTIINFNFDLADLVPELGKLGDEDEIEITDDEDDDLSALGGDDEEEPSMDLTGGSPDVGSEPSKKEDELPLAEAVKRGKGPATSKTLAENKALKAQLAEQTLFNAKVVHMQPFMNNRNLTKEQKQKIVEYLDRGKTVDEVKAIYGRVKTVLENIQKAKAKAGSSSRASTPGGANLSESVENRYEGATLVAEERNRLMQLAGIKRK